MTVVHSFVSCATFKMNFAGLFNTFGSLGCALDHDRVFALLGLISESEKQERIEVDYDMPKTRLPSLCMSSLKSNATFDRNAIEQELFLADFVFSLRLTVQEIRQDRESLEWHLLPSFGTPPLESWDWVLLKRERGREEYAYDHGTIFVRLSNYL
jgi:hypothetical protein